MKYPGGKNAPGVCQRIISQIPPHRVFVELFGGSAAVTRTMLAAERNVVIERNPAVAAEFSGDGHHAEWVVGDAIRWLVEHMGDIEPDWCLYADPPYHPETLRCEQKYACKFSAGDHMRLLTLLLELPCPVLVSGYRHPLYDVTLRTWRRIGYWTYDRANRRRSESLWMNFAKPRWLHDARFVGVNRRQRETRARRRRTLVGRIRRADAAELQVMAHELDEELFRRIGTRGSAADPGGGVLRRSNGRRSTGKLLATPEAAAGDGETCDAPGNLVARS